MKILEKDIDILLAGLVHLGTKNDQSFLKKNNPNKIIRACFD